jgi:hypothetical protein
MTLRTHHYLSILPLFLLLGIANSALSAWLDTQELRSSLEQERRILETVETHWPQSLLPTYGYVAPQPTPAEERLDRLYQTLWLRAFVFTGVALLAGILVAEILTRLSLRELRLLSTSAEQLSQGLQQSTADGGKIREFADLGSTLATLSQILQENDQQNRIRLLRHDRQND